MKKINWGILYILTCCFLCATIATLQGTPTEANTYWAALMVIIAVYFK